MIVDVHIPRYVDSPGFWEFYTVPGRIVGKTHRGNLLVRFGFVTRVFDKVTGFCVSDRGRKYVPENFRQLKVTGFA